MPSVNQPRPTGTVLWGLSARVFSRKLETSLSGLKCVCQLCEHTNFTCQTEGACWASVMLTNGREEVVKSCVSLPELNAQVFCHSSKNITKTECCYTDFCNNITLRLPVGKSRPSAELFEHLRDRLECRSTVPRARPREPVRGVLKADSKAVAIFFPTCFRQEDLNHNSVWGKVNFLHLLKMFQMLSVIPPQALTVKMKGSV